MSATSSATSLLKKTLPLAALIALGACTGAERNAGGEAPATSASAPATEPTDPAAAATSSSARGPDLEELTPTERSAAIEAVGRCMIDTAAAQPLVDGQELRVSTSSKVQFIGWVGDPQTQTFPRDPALRFDLQDGSRAWEVGLGEPYARAPVAEMYKTETMKSTGFATEVDLSALPPGTYSVRTVYNISGDPKRRVACNRDFRIRIGD